MIRRYPVTPDVEQVLEACHNDNELQANGTSIKKLSRDAAPEALILTSDSQSPPIETVSQKAALHRLQQAAHILATGAIRAAQKLKAARNEPQKETHDSISPMSGYRISGDIQCENVPRTPPKKTLKAAKSSRPGKRNTTKA